MSKRRKRPRGARSRLRRLRDSAAQLRAATRGLWNALLDLPSAAARILKSRVFRELLYVLPAVAGLAAVTYTGVWVARRPASGVPMRYKQAAQLAVSQSRLDVARWWDRKLCYLTPKDPQPRYELGIIAQRQGNRDRAERLIRQVAPDARAVYAPAHFWVARSLTDAKADSAEALVANRKRVQLHLRHVIDLEPRNMQARHILGEICARTGEVNEAISHLTIASEEWPADHLTVARLFQVRGDRSLAETHGKAFRDFFAKKLAANPADIDAELAVAAADIFLGNSERAVEALNRGYERTKDGRYTVGLTAAYVAAFDQTNPSDVAKRLDLIAQAWKLSPDSVAVLTRLDEIVASAGPQAKQARKSLQKSAESGKSSGVAHYALAGAAVREGDFALALVHAEAAYAALPAVPELANNLAFLLSQKAPPDLDRALKMANSAVNAQPRNPSFRETRGQILTRLQKFRDAVTDLELALTQLRNMPAIHKSLAEAYEQLGDRELAARHQALFAAQTEKPKP